MFAITETWITPSATGAELLAATPPGLTLISYPCPTSCVGTSSNIGGGMAFLIRKPAVFLPSNLQTFLSCFSIVIYLFFIFVYYFYLLFLHLQPYPRCLHFFISCFISSMQGYQK
jgi:hypothetical protein